MKDLPPSVTHSGWPKRLTDHEGFRYVRVRDGCNDHVERAEWECLYALELASGGLNRENLWTPEEMPLAGEVAMEPMPWLSDEEFEAMGEPPPVLPSG